MFQLARQNQRHNDRASTHRSVDRTLDHSRAIAPGKRANTDNLNAAYNGTPDYYTRAVESAMRELDALRATALPHYVAIRRKQGLDPIAKQIELAKSAMQVRHMILCANNHVYALEKAATHKDPMVLWLRVRMDRVVAQATKLGCYADAMDMIPQRFIDDTKQKNAAKKTHNVSTKTRHQAPAPTPSVFASAQTASIRKAANPKAGNTARPATSVPAARIARGTSAPAPATRAAAPAPVRTPVQRKATGTAAQGNAQAVAARGVESASAPLPFASVIQRAFGRHDVSSIRVQIGGAATKASQKLGAKAYATGNLIAFAHDPDLHTAAHEAAHVIQQRHGVSLAGGVDDGPSDSYERHADDVADAVVAGKSVEHMFGELRNSAAAAPVVQRKATDSFTHATKARDVPGLTAGLEKLGAKAE